MFSRRDVVAVGAAGLVGLAGAGRAKADGPQLVVLARADGRPLNCNVWRPAGPRRRLAPVLLFSHGALCGSATYDVMLSRIAARGYAVIAPDHLDGEGPEDARAKIRPKELIESRVADMRLLLDNPEPFDNVLQHGGVRLDWRRAAVGGHSLGALTAQALAGATMLDQTTHLPVSHPDPRIHAVLLISPPGPAKTLAPPEIWSTLRLPTLVQTGEKDINPGFLEDWTVRIAGYDAIPGVERWTAIGAHVDHYFGGLICRPQARSNPDGMAGALAEATAIDSDFLDAVLRGDAAARARLSAGAYGPEFTVKRVQPA